MVASGWLLSFKNGTKVTDAMKDARCLTKDFSSRETTLSSTLCSCHKILCVLVPLGQKGLCLFRCDR
jgi:hypothetical protein